MTTASPGLRPGDTGVRRSVDNSVLRQRVDLVVPADPGGQQPQVVVAVAEQVVERGQPAGVGADAVLRRHADAAVELDRLLADVPTRAADAERRAGGRGGG